MKLEEGKIYSPNCDYLNTISCSNKLSSQNSRLDFYIIGDTICEEEYIENKYVRLLAKKLNKNSDKNMHKSAYDIENDYYVHVFKIDVTKNKNNELYKIACQIGSIIKDQEYSVINISIDIDIDEFNLKTLCSRILYTSFENNCYKSNPTLKSTIDELNVIVNKSNIPSTIEIIQESVILAKSMIITSALIDAPANYCTPKSFGKFVLQLFMPFKGVGIKILDENEIKNVNMGCFNAVAKASMEGARLIHLSYNTNKGYKKYALVGKGITMDTGGYSLKASTNMMWMKYDMAGAATIIGAFYSLVLSKVDNIEIHAIAAVTANMVDQKAYMLGDIVTASNGKTVEIQNTDAEGRLVLADALVYAENELGSDKTSTIIDLATLTGACRIALGTDICAIFANKTELAENIIKGGAQMGEIIWNLPLYEGYKNIIKSNLADLRNHKSGYSFAGSITAALFLKEFVSDSINWAHLDIAGVAWNDDKCSSNAWGILTLTNILKNKLV